MGGAMRLYTGLTWMDMLPLAPPCPRGEGKTPRHSYQQHRGWQRCTGCWLGSWLLWGSLGSG